MEDQPITVLIGTKKNASKRNFTNIHPMANMGWNPMIKQWQIKYKYPPNELSCIHELGHIYLAVQLNELDYARTPLIAKSNFTLLYNILNDQFVNYKLFKFPEFREYLENRFIKYMNQHKILLIKAFITTGFCMLACFWNLIGLFREKQKKNIPKLV